MVSTEIGPPVAWLVFVDDLHLDFRQTGRIRTAMRTIGAELVQEGDSLAMVSSGPSPIAVAPTTDPQIFATTIRRISGNALKLSDLVRDPDSADEVRYRVATTLTRLSKMMAEAEGSTGAQTAVLLISNGSSFELFGDRRTSRPLGQGRDVTFAQVHDHLASVQAAARRSSVTIFPIDLAFAEFEIDRNNPALEAHLAARQAMLQSLAAATSGEVIGDRDLTGGLSRIAAAMGR